MDGRWETLPHQPRFNDPNIIGSSAKIWVTDQPKLVPSWALRFVFPRLGFLLSREMDFD